MRDNKKTNPIGEKRESSTNKDNTFAPAKAQRQEKDKESLERKTRRHYG